MNTRSSLTLAYSVLYFLVMGFDTAAQPLIPRAEHPKPQFQRDAWINLNGAWNFAIDTGLSGLAKGWHDNPSAFDRVITVPYCPESKLSGIGYTDFMPAVWYHRSVTIPDDWDGSRVFLHFGAVDYECRVWVNGHPVGRHYGGAVSFAFEITAALQAGANDLVVLAVDDIRSGVQPAGKQSVRLKSRGVMYTRVTGIWQTVWLEARPQTFIDAVHIVPDLDNGRFVLTPTFNAMDQRMEFRAIVQDPDGNAIGSITSTANSGVPLSITLDAPRPWSPEDPYLYDLRFELRRDGRVVDQVRSYAGLRKFHIENHKFYLNNKPIFLRFVLDQGFYPDGIWTAPTDAALKRDIELSMAVGFNGARLHQKVFEERFHYWADTLGYLTWGEYCDWGPPHNFDTAEGIHNVQREWREVVVRDRNHPSIIAWTPYNETRRGAEQNPEAYRRAVRETVALTRSLDPTRPINDASGYVHVITDIFTVHDYTQSVDIFRERYAPTSPDNLDGTYVQHANLSIAYGGQPYMVDEYGGTFWLPSYSRQPPRGTGRNGWGYGKTAEEVETLIGALTKILLTHPNIAGYTYTQLTDVEQEVNGVYTYERELKFNTERMREIFGGPAAIEQP